MIGQRVGVLRDDGNQFTFRYDAAWLEEQRACALSRQLPLQSEAFEGQRVNVFFGGLLPEAGSRDQNARKLGISANNDFAMLERIGGECAGAIALVPEEMEGRARSDAGVRWLSEGEVIGIMDRLPHQPLLAGDHSLIRNMLTKRVLIHRSAMFDTSRNRGFEFPSGQAGTKRNSTFRPRAAAALPRLATVSDGFWGSRIRSSEALLVFILEAS